MIEFILGVLVGAFGVFFAIWFDLTCDKVESIIKAIKDKITSNNK